PIHTDAEYAGADPIFGERIAHGALVLSVGLGLGTFWPPAVTAFYGIDRLRFLPPTPIGDTIHVETRVTAVTPRDTGTGVVPSDFVVRNQTGQEVLVASLKLLVSTRA